ncbi:hypothetical protein ASG87_05490 [Frateuria sp. Soil773]|uniref:hypothetical protein n=1 Tax=Frateuria sp. Soil773 TaxID=1736407 RepID=UPI0006FB1DEE|nr:hypothetical protein [Frateuria sp. Soil773]KRE89004.1 hypothetical protein ASG87_05490 [Frateuria sp. Soil773]
MLVDIYRSGVNPAQFVAIPIGQSLAAARLPDTPDLADLQLYLQGTDIVSSGEFDGVDVRAIMEQLTRDGFAAFQARLR